MAKGQSALLDRKKLFADPVMITTIISAFTLTFWIWLARSLGMI